VTTAGGLERGKTGEILRTVVTPKALVRTEADVRAFVVAGRIPEFQFECRLT